MNHTRQGVLTVFTWVCAQFPSSGIPLKIAQDDAH